MRRERLAYKTAKQQNASMKAAESFERSACCKITHICVMKYILNA